MFQNQSIVFLLSVLCLFSCTEKAGDSKDVFVYNARVFEEYKGTKLIQQKLIKKQEGQKHQLDSMLAEIQVKESAVQANKLSQEQKVQFMTRRNEYQRLMNEYQAGNSEEFQQAQQALWVQINQYIKDYGQEQGYRFIHGATGTGNLMYADTSRDVSNQVIEYINQRYEGKH